MKVKLPSGKTIVLAQDAIWMQENLEGYPAGMNYSVKDYGDSVSRLKFIRDIENAELLFGHDPDQFKPAAASGIGSSPVLAAGPSTRGAGGGLPLRV